MRFIRDVPFPTPKNHPSMAFGQYHGWIAPKLSGNPAFLRHSTCASGSEKLSKTAGLIFSGGQSKRFGAEKALALLDGQPLLARVAARLAPQVGPLAVAGNAHDSGLLALSDEPFAGCGPLAGLRAGLEWATAQAGVQWLLTAPCDVPLLPKNLAGLLLQGAALGHPAAVRSAGHLQVACALWPVTALEQIEAALGEESKNSLHHAFELCGGIEIDVTGSALDGSFANINTPADLEAHASSAV